MGGFLSLAVKHFSGWECEGLDQVVDSGAKSAGPWWVVTLDHVLEGFRCRGVYDILRRILRYVMGLGFLNVGSFWPAGRVKTRILRATCLRHGDLLKPFADARYHKHQPFAQDLAKL